MLYLSLHEMLMGSGKLPVDLLWESDLIPDRESVEYTESVFRLLKVHPETAMSIEQKHNIL